MGIVSYAQNFEDVILWRALGHIPNGVYIDIGAHHPDIDSVSKAFHDHGWRGVHVEPGPEVARLLRDKRPGDTVLQAIVSDEIGVKAFYVTPGGGLSTADREVADFHLEQQHAPVSITSVVAITLDDVLDHVPGDDIHWMKIDVEGFERKALLSWKTSSRRPWIIIIEATYPKTRTPTYGEWEDIVVSKGYSFVYDDGLNRFYLSDSHAELRDKLIYPPNVFDEFQLNPSGASVFSQEIKAFMEGEIYAREDRIGELEAKHERVQAESDEKAAQLKHELDRVQQEAGERIAQLEQEVDRVQREAGERVAQLEQEVDRVQREALQERSLHDRLRESWKGAIVRAEDLVLRLVEREASIAAHEQHLAQLDADFAQMKSAFEQLRSQDACTRSVLARSIADRSLPWPLRIWRQSARATALGRLLALPDADFIDGAYGAILGREADPHGKQHYLAKMAGGRPRGWLLQDITSSQEARNYASGSDLTELDDENFVDAAYWRALGRAPDPEGKEHYIQLLQAGLTRPDLLQVLWESAEGREHGEGMRQEIHDFVRRRRSLLRWRTWFCLAPMPPLFDASRDVMHSPAPEAGLAAPSSDPAEVETPIVTVDHADMRRFKDKVALLTAAVEGIGRRQQFMTDSGHV